MCKIEKMDMLLQKNTQMLVDFLENHYFCTQIIHIINITKIFHFF